MNSHQIVTMPLADLKPAPYNPRTISKASLKGLTASIKRFGLVQPIVLNKRSGLVVGGHQRIEALKAAGATDAPVVVVDLDENEEKALNIALNSPAISGTFTDDLQPMLASLREALPHEFIDIRMDELLRDLKAPGADEDEIPAPPRIPIVKPGETWTLGDHTLLCGDSSKLGIMRRFLGSDQVHLCFTDPPYGINYGKKNRLLNSFQKAGRNLKDIASDTLGKDALCKMLVAAFSEAFGVARDDCAFYVTAPQGGELGLMMMMMMMMMAGLPVRHVLIWNKNSPNFSLGRLDYEYKHEPILYCWKKTHRFFGKGEFTNSVWDIPKPRQSAEHPTMKPVDLMVNAILNSSRIGEIVLDMFSGSGSTLIACERTERKARCVEIDPSYCDVTIERWEKFTGGKAKKSSLLSKKGNI